MRNWRLVVGHFDEVAPDARQQCLVVVAAEWLPPRDYVQFVSDLCDLRVAGRATPQAIWTVLFARMNKADFLDYNYNVPEVSSVIDKLEAIMLKENPKQYAEYFKEMKSGELKQNAIERSKREGDPMPESFYAKPGLMTRLFENGVLLLFSSSWLQRFAARSPALPLTGRASVVFLGLFGLIVLCLIALGFLIWKIRRSHQRLSIETH